MRNVLISGASIAGPALAFWLNRYGYTTTIVERAPGIRPGGQAVDVRGTALTVIERMGLMRELREAAVHMEGMSFVDGEGTELFRDTQATLTGGVIDNPDIEILRDDLADILYEATRGSTRYLFDDTITSVDAGTGHVTFEKHAPESFDLIVGADGMHSTVRRLAFGPEQRYLHHLDTYLAVFSVPNFLDLDSWQTFHRHDDRMCGLYTVRGNREARAVMGFFSPPLGLDHRDTETPRRLLEERFADDGWVVPRLLAEMRRSTDFHFDAMAQIRMDSWSTGRVTLIGDAGYCGSPLSGQGTSMALVGAYVLAGELARGEGQAGYEKVMRPFSEANQDFALRMNVWQRNQEGAPPSVDEVSALITLKDYV
ncbi:FAD-dependent monooxygenase [Nonomuraea soli]|uniref:2-polyprenyl-6-methoxyphenol hydroxylase-like FAD-dependent oxidoreductase n=1 Tax=Nonomuraea soli TaxID=1032476 RepID=A0A7W0CEV1_9ACTN|nr:FAD-dependent monooxygenase [Nonomuraea soli]MBA2889724.1 2-polyprenyl-6-methoxyphenol hydroxylase-like FAD-dependent oxidoreductase [Nonomuraea soli]